MAAGEIDDAEAAHAETRAVADVDSFIVRAAVDDLLAHVVDERFGDVALASCAHYSGDSTHKCRFAFSLAAPEGASETSTVTARFVPVHFRE